MQQCILCDFQVSPEYISEKYKLLHCTNCDLLFKSPEVHLTFSEEKHRYDQHNNDPNDSRYQNFLKPVVDLVTTLQNPKDQGLDFGCGPGPCITPMLQSQGYTCTNYDPIYFPDTQSLNQKYDYITCTEVVEHFHRPKKSWLQLISLLRSKASLYVMTGLPPEKSLTDWWYLKDDTHICFYTPKCMQWIADTYRLKLQSYSKKGIYGLKKDTGRFV